MDLDELQSVQSRERQTDSLQQLRATFYKDAAEFIQGLEAERSRAAERADDPWNSPEVGRLNDDIDTAEQTVEAIYERRVGKIVKMASLAAADMPTDDNGLTEEEGDLFETLVEAIERNRDQVFAILDGDAPLNAPEDAPGAASADGVDPAAATSSEEPGRASPPDEPRTAASSGSGTAADPGESSPAADPAGTGRGTASDGEGGDGRAHPDPAELGDPEPAAVTDPDSGRPAGETTADRSTGGESAESRVDAADLMAGDGDPGSPADAAPSTGREGEHSPGTEADSPPVERSDGGVAVPESGGTRETDATGEAREMDATGGGRETDAAGGDAVDRATVKITADVGEIFGVDERAYDLTENDVVRLPEANAGPLVDRDAAERLD